LSILLLLIMFSTAVRSSLARQARALSTRAARVVSTEAGISSSLVLAAGAGVGAAYLYSSSPTQCATVVEVAPGGAVTVTVGGGPKTYSGPIVKDLMEVAKVKATMPDNICMEQFDFKYFDSLTEEQQGRLMQCVRTGFENPDSGLGCYAMAPGDYDEFAPFFDAVCQKYHKASPTDVHVCDWDASEVGENGVLDVTKLGLDELSMRVRVGRNLKAYNLPGAMGKDERVQFEKSMLVAFEKLVEDPEYGKKR
jgi:hypothetical protein